MEKSGRSARIAAMVSLLSSRPNRVATLSHFCGLFMAAKSSISEDVAIADASLRSHGLGRLETVAGAAGGVRFRPCRSRGADYDFILHVCDVLSDPTRTLPGGYLYLSDLLSDPEIIRRMGCILACRYYHEDVDFVLTMETRGIPVALMTADALGVPLVIARRAGKVYEGSSVNISFHDGKGAIESMSLPRRSVKEGQRALIVDDFIREGGTAHGMLSLMKEFAVKVVGMAFILAQEKPSRRLVHGERALMLFHGDGETEPMRVKPADWLREEDA